MARYVIAGRRSGARDGVAASRFAVVNALEALGPVSILRDINVAAPAARRITVIEAEPTDVEMMLANLQDVIVEPEILHRPVETTPIDLQGAPLLGLVSLSGGFTHVVAVRGGSQPLPGARVDLYVRGPGGVSRVEGRSDANGAATFNLPSGYVAEAAVVVPQHSHWSMIVRGPQLSSPVDCPVLPTAGPIGWWSAAVGQSTFDASAGAGIRVGVIDTGVGPHPTLAHVEEAGGFEGADIDTSPGASRDIAQHGTHVAGTIGARPIGAGQYGGVAPGCDLFGARVFRTSDTAGQAEIAAAIDILSRVHGVDLINMSLGASTPSRIIQEAIQDAEELGTLCIVAAGNSAGAVNYPAAFPEAVAVAAVGLSGWGPAGSISASRLPLSLSLFGLAGRYSANFTCHGSEIDCTAPGVGVIAPVPAVELAAPYAAMDGTSMAAPLACGVLAVLLSRDAAYRALPRDRSRAAAARSILSGALRDAGLPSAHQGRGIPSI